MINEVNKVIITHSLNLWYFHGSLYGSANQMMGEGNGTPLQYSCLENPLDGRAWWAAVHGVTKSQTWLSNFTFTFHFYALEKEMATHSSVLAWRIPWTEKPGRLPSMGLHRVGHDWSDLAAADQMIATTLYNTSPFLLWLTSHLDYQNIDMRQIKIWKQIISSCVLNKKHLFFLKPTESCQRIIFLISLLVNIIYILSNF